MKEGRNNRPTYADQGEADGNLPGLPAAGDDEERKPEGRGGRRIQRDREREKGICARHREG